MTEAYQPTQIEDTSLQAAEPAFFMAEKAKLQEMLQTITPPETYLPDGRTAEKYTRVIDAGNMHYVKIGAIDAKLQTLAQDETFDRFPWYDSRGAAIPAGTGVVAIQDIKPFGYTRQLEDADARTAAKLHLTADMLRLVWETEEINPDYDTYYVLTNPHMARFMKHKWGFHALRAGDDELLDEQNPPDDSYVMVANKADIEAMYPYLAEYIPDLMKRMELAEQEVS